MNTRDFFIGFVAGLIVFYVLNWFFKSRSSGYTGIEFTDSMTVEEAKKLIDDEGRRLVEEVNKEVAKISGTDPMAQAKLINDAQDKVHEMNKAFVAWSAQKRSK